MITKIGDYELGQNIDTSSLKEVEVSYAELAGILKNDPSYMKNISERFFSAEDYKNCIKRDICEKIYEGENAQLLNVDWTTKILSKGDKIQTIALYHEAKSKQEGESIFEKAFKYITENMGKHTKHPFFTKLFGWNGKEEDICLMKDTINGKDCVMITFTKKND